MLGPPVGPHVPLRAARFAGGSESVYGLHQRRVIVGSCAVIHEPSASAFIVRILGAVRAGYRGERSSGSTVFTWTSISQ